MTGSIPGSSRRAPRLAGISQADRAAVLSASSAEDDTAPAGTRGLRDAFGILAAHGQRDSESAVPPGLVASGGSRQASALVPGITSIAIPGPAPGMACHA